jgi:hypothetical protein
MNYVETLHQLLEKHFFWHKARVECLSMLIFSLLKVRNVQITRLCEGIESAAKSDSTIKRIYRFFKLQIIEQSQIAIFIKNALNISDFTLILDRTNWEFGKIKINILYLAIAFQGIAIPVFFKILANEGGNSCADDRIELVKKFTIIFNISRIKAILGDREFFDEKWIKYLSNNGINFCIRIKSSKKIRHVNGGAVQAKSIVDKFPANVSVHTNKSQLIYGSKVKITMKKLKNDYFILVYSEKFTRQEAIALYKDRWGIECMFKAMKSNGFNMEDTHMVHFERLERLFSVLTIAFVVAIKFGMIKHEFKPIKIKNHNRRMFSIFSYGLNFLRKILMQREIFQEIIEIIQLLNSRIKNQLIVKDLCVRY